MIDFTKSDREIAVKLLDELKPLGWGSSALKHAESMIDIMRLAVAANQPEMVETIISALKDKVVNITEEPENLPKPYKGNENNVLVIPDMHLPYTNIEYILEMRKIQEKFDCGTVVFIGDLVDQYSWSRWGADPDYFDPTGEYNQTMSYLAMVYKLFPKAYLTLGNHDERVKKRASAEGLNKFFIKSFQEVYDCPKEWHIAYEVDLHDVIYTHGSIGDAYKNSVLRGQSLVQGHYHTKAGVQWNATNGKAIFGMQVGTIIDDASHAFAYGKLNSKRSVQSCGLVLDKGTQAFIYKLNQKPLTFTQEL